MSPINPASRDVRPTVDPAAPAASASAAQVAGTQGEYDWFSAAAQVSRPIVASAASAEVSRRSVDDMVAAILAPVCR